MDASTEYNAMVCRLQEEMADVPPEKREALIMRHHILTQGSFDRPHDNSSPPLQRRRVSQEPTEGGAGGGGNGDAVLVQAHPNEVEMGSCEGETDGEAPAFFSEMSEEDRREVVAMVNQMEEQYMSRPEAEAEIARKYGLAAAQIVALQSFLRI